MINILILNWNSGSQCLKAINHIIKSDFLDFRILIIDNNSGSEDLKYLEECRLLAYSKEIDFHIIHHLRNSGYAEGNNIGLNYLKSKNLEGDLMIMNPDISIQPNSLREMKQALSQQNVAGVMIRTCSPNGNILYDYFSLKGFVQTWLKGKKDCIIETDYLAGSCMLLSREVIDRFSLFDDSFFMYWEEVDLSLRLRGNGFKIVSTTYSSVYREDNDYQRKANAIYFLVRNAFILQKKHANLNSLDMCIYLCRFFLTSCLGYLRTWDFNFLFNFFKGFAAGIKV